MILQNYSQNKWDASKNICRPRSSNASECRVKNLIQKYEQLGEGAKNNNFQSSIKYKRTKSEQCLTSNMSVALNLGTVNRFLSLENENQNVINNGVTSGVDNNKNNCDIKKSAQPKNPSKSNFKIYVDEIDKEKKVSQGNSPSSAKRKEDFWKLFSSNDRKTNHHQKQSKESYTQIEYRNYTLPNYQKQENSSRKNFFRSFSTTPKDKKTKPLSYQKEKQQPLSENGIILPNTGAIKKQTNPDDVMYRKRRDSYVMATQNDENFRKIKIFPENGKQSYVSKTISKFETSDIVTKVEQNTEEARNKIEDLLQQYHDNKFGAFNKFTREELNLEIDNVLLNRFRLISHDKSPENLHSTSEGNRNNSQQNIDSKLTNSDTNCIIVANKNNDISVQNVKHDSVSNIDLNALSQGQKLSEKISQTNLSGNDKCDINVREKLTTELNRVLSKESFKGSIENLCDNLEKVINDNLSSDVRVKDICVSVESDDENTIESERIYENLRFIDQQINELQQFGKNETFPEPKIDEDMTPQQIKRKVSNLVEYFTEIISESSGNEQSTIKKRSSISGSGQYDDNQNIDSTTKPDQYYSARSYCANSNEASDELQKGESFPNIRVTDIDEILQNDQRTAMINGSSNDLKPKIDYSASKKPFSQEEISKDESSRNSESEDIQSDLNYGNSSKEELSKRIYENWTILGTSSRGESFSSSHAKANSPSIKITDIDQVILQENRRSSDISVSFDHRKPRIDNIDNKELICPEEFAEYENPQNSDREDILLEVYGSYDGDSSCTDKFSEEFYANLKTIPRFPSSESFSSSSSEDFGQSACTGTSSEPNIYENIEEIRLFKPFLVDNPENHVQANLETRNIVILNPPSNFICLGEARNMDELESEVENKLFERDQSFSSENLDTRNECNNGAVPKRRSSRLYSGKFSKRNSSVSSKQDTNNNEYTETTATEKTSNNSKTNSEQPDKSTNDTEENIYMVIKTDCSFLSDSDGDYDSVEAFNYQIPRPIDVERRLSTSDAVEKAAEKVQQSQNRFCSDFDDDNDDDDDVEHIYERIKKSGSSGTLCTIYDDQKNPIIRMSMNLELDDFETVGDQGETKKIEDIEKELEKNIKEIRDNSKKACLINELLTTEKSYIKQSLRRIVVDYMPEMEAKGVPKGLMGKSPQIFGNADLLYEEHRHRFYPKLKRHTNEEELADCFLKHETLFKLYPLYSKNKPKSDIVLKDYGSYFKKKQEELNDKLDLASYLLAPIQRLAKYCQFVKGILKECEKESIAGGENPCLQKLRCALEMLNKQMRMGNDLIALDSIVGYNKSVRDHGEVLLRDVFMVQPPSKRPAYEGMVFLFQECLLITAIARQDFRESFIYRENFHVTDMGYTEIASEPLEFSVWFRKRGNNNFRFRTKNKEVKQKWVKEIFNLLWKQLEANKRKIKKEMEEQGVKDTRVPVIRPYSVPNKDKEPPSSGYSTTKSKRKNTLNSSADTIWYFKNDAT